MAVSSIAEEESAVLGDLHTSAPSCTARNMNESGFWLMQQGMSKQCECNIWQSLQASYVQPGGTAGKQLGKY